MKNLTDKIRVIYKPFLLIAIGFIVVYTLLHWLLFIQMGIFLKEDIIKFWLPFALPFIPVFIWLRPRIKLLKFKNDNGSFGYQMLAVLAIAEPSIIAQEYLITATGRMTTLSNINQLSTAAKTKYYSLQHYYIDKQHIGVNNTVTITGKNNRDYNMYVYVVMPIVTSEKDTANTRGSNWLGKKYEKRISNKQSDKVKDAEYASFAEQCQKEFDTTNFGNFNYLETIGNTDDHDEFDTAIRKVMPAASNPNHIFTAHTGSFASRNGSKLFWIGMSFVIGAVIYFLLLCIPKFQEGKLEQFKAGQTGSKEKDLKETFEFLIPKEGFFITPIIINLNLLVYLLMVFSGLGLVSFKGKDLLHWGANYKPLTINGEWWRLLTSTFLHGGIMHILANMFALVFVGLVLEPFLGKWKFALVYLVTGIAASIASIVWYDATVSVGASGAIFGLYGFFLACIVFKAIPPELGKVFLISTLVFVGFNLVMGLAGGIDNAAHIGGLGSGFLLGAGLSGYLKRQNLAYETGNEQ